MSDTDGKKPLGLGGTPRSGQVKQSFSHGRTKSVVVETKRKRVVVPTKPGAPGAAPATGGNSHLGDPSKRPAGISDAEMERRLTALRAAKAREAEDNLRRAAEELAREEERARKREEIDAKEREDREREDALKARADEEARVKAEAEADAKRIEAAKAAPRPKPSAATPAPAVDERGPMGAKPALAPARSKTDRDRDNRADDGARGKAKADESRRTGRLSLNDALAGDGRRTQSMAAMKRKQV